MLPHCLVSKNQFRMKILTLFLTPILWVVFFSFSVSSFAQEDEKLIKSVKYGVRASDGVTLFEDAVSNGYLVVGAPFLEAVDYGELVEPADLHYSVAGSQWQKVVRDGDAVEYVPVAAGELVEPNSRYRFTVTVKSEEGWFFKGYCECSSYARIEKIENSAQLYIEQRTGQLDITFNYESRPKMEWVNIQFASDDEGGQKSWTPISVVASDEDGYYVRDAEDIDLDGSRVFCFDVNSKDDTTYVVKSVFVGSTKIMINGEEQPLFLASDDELDIVQDRVGKFTLFYGVESGGLCGFFFYAKDATALPNVTPGHASSAPAYDLAGRRVIVPSRGVPFVKDGKLAVVR